MIKTIERINSFVEDVLPATCFILGLVFSTLGISGDKSELRDLGLFLVIWAEVLWVRKDIRKVKEGETN